MNVCTDAGGLLAVAGFVYQLSRNLAHHLRLRIFSDPYRELQSVPAVLFAIVSQKTETYQA